MYVNLPFLQPLQCLNSRLLAWKVCCDECGERNGEGQQQGGEREQRTMLTVSFKSFVTLYSFLQYIVHSVQTSQLYSLRLVSTR